MRESVLDAIILRPGSLIGKGKTSTSRLFSLADKGFMPDFQGGASFLHAEQAASVYAWAIDISF